MDKLPELPQRPRLLNLNASTPQELADHLSAMVGYHCARVAYWEARCRLAVEVLTNVRKGEGRFSMDHMTHASNTIEDMKELAANAIDAIGPLPAPHTDAVQK